MGAGNSAEALLAGTGNPIDPATLLPSRRDAQAELLLEDSGAHLADFVSAYNFAKRLKTLKSLTPYQYICKAWTKEPERFTLNPLQQIPGLNI